MPGAGLRAALGGAKVGGKVLGSGFGRVAIGAGVGAVAGGAMSDSNTGTGTFESIARGAMWGAAAGALTSKSLWKGIAGRVSGVTQGAKAARAAKAAGAGAVAAAAEGVGAGAAVHGRRAMKAAKLGGWALQQANKGIGWALEHPTGALLLAGGAAGGYQLMKSGPGRANIDTDEMAYLGAQSGLSSSGFSGGEVTSHQNFMNSTHGLVQGLHRGRH
jgi:hypothetical protein